VSYIYQEGGARFMAFLEQQQDKFDRDLALQRQKAMEL
jgi:hypothetical protein